MLKLKKEQIKNAENFLDERLFILSHFNYLKGTNHPDEAFYNGALAMLQHLGIDYIVRENEHRIIK